MKDALFAILFLLGPPGWLLLPLWALLPDDEYDSHTRSAGPYVHYLGHRHGDPGSRSSD